jgi:GH43 family beta-xylosidase
MQSTRCGRTVLLAVVTASVVVAGTAATGHVASAATAGCRVAYTIGSQWNTGFTANVSVTNLGDPLNGWTLTWSYTADQRVTQGWNADVTQSGAQVSARNAAWNGGLATNASVSFGFNATWTGGNPAPTTFALNGTTCTGSAQPTAPPTATTPPTSQPPVRNTFTNPIKAQGPDPWLKYYNGFYYLATTTWNNTVTMRRSRTLGGLSSAPDQVLYTMPAGMGTMWAPEFHLLNGPNGQRWYLYYVAGNAMENVNSQRIRVLESAGTDPMGPYTFKADMFDPVANNTWELDPSILLLNGRMFLLGTFFTNGVGQRNFIRELSNPWTAAGTRRVLAELSNGEGGVNEGAEVLQRNGRTFVVYSAVHCSSADYHLRILTYNGGDPLNASSWVKSPTPVFRRNDANRVFGPGHNGFFTSPDGTEDWIVYHATSTPGGCDINRSTRAQRFTWNADGTPNFGTPVALGATLTAPSGEPAS